MNRAFGALALTVVLAATRFVAPSCGGEEAATPGQTLTSTPGSPSPGAMPCPVRPDVCVRVSETVSLPKEGRYEQLTSSEQARADLRDVVALLGPYGWTMESFGCPYAADRKSIELCAAGFELALQGGPTLIVLTFLAPSPGARALYAGSAIATGGDEDAVRTGVGVPRRCSPPFAQAFREVPGAVCEATVFFPGAR